MHLERFGADSGRAGLIPRRTWVRFSPLVVHGVYPEQD
jgi:hypothetical protein